MRNEPVGLRRVRPYYAPVRGDVNRHILRLRSGRVPLVVLAPGGYQMLCVWAGWVQVVSWYRAGGPAAQTGLRWPPLGLPGGGWHIL